MECAKIWFANFVPSTALVPNDLKSILLEAHKISFHFKLLTIARFMKHLRSVNRTDLAYQAVLLTHVISNISELRV